jgi:hypothetical protein
MSLYEAIELIENLVGESVVQFRHQIVNYPFAARGLPSDCMMKIFDLGSSNELQICTFRMWVNMLKAKYPQHRVKLEAILARVDAAVFPAEEVQKSLDPLILYNPSTHGGECTVVIGSRRFVIPVFFLKCINSTYFDAALSGRWSNTQCIELPSEYEGCCGALVHMFERREFPDIDFIGPKRVRLFIHLTQFIGCDMLYKAGLARLYSLGMKIEDSKEMELIGRMLNQMTINLSGL